MYYIPRQRLKRIFHICTIQFPYPYLIEQTQLTMRRSRMKSFDVATQVAKGFWEVVALAGKLLWALRTSCKWIIMTIRLIVFVGLLLPAFMGMFGYWLCSKTVKKNIEYGKNPRNLLDIYTDDSEQLKPVVVFFSGGAWIIGYKAWGCLMGKVLANCGIVFVTPDYRNFPQGNIPEMIEDGNAAMEWVFENIHVHGGDKQRVTLMGQSAGAHIAACILLVNVYMYICIQCMLLYRIKCVVSWRGSL